MKNGAPCYLNAETTRENALLHLKEGNHASIGPNIRKVMKVMNKEDTNNYVIPFPAWIARFIPHTFFTPQHLLQKPGKKGSPDLRCHTAVYTDFGPAQPHDIDKNGAGGYLRYHKTKNIATTMEPTHHLPEARHSHSRQRLQIVLSPATASSRRLGRIRIYPFFLPIFPHWNDIRFKH